ncbi:MAG: ribonuclease J [Candidatus Gracilibacteria bacterium]|nr:ribonuclease J [Candidatus Gracilibacteria bacterium]
MKDFLDELDQEIDGIQNNDDIVDQHIILNEGMDGTTENIEAEQKQLHKNVKTFSNNQNNSNNPNKQNKPKQESNEIRGKFISKFPETKFYLPSLREGYTRFIPIGGNNETGAKNMGMAQYGDDIILMDCGVQFADADMLGVNYSIPDVSFLVNYKKNIKGFLITHAHLDHIGSLKHVYPALGCPTLYGTKFTIGLIKKQLEEAGLLSYATLVEVDAGKKEKIKIGQFEVEFFKVNHSVPDCAGLYIESPGGTKIVHTGDFKIDFTPAIDTPADLDRISEIGSRGISVLMSDSTGSTRKGFSMSEKNVGEELEKIVSNHHKGRLIIATFSSWISRVQQLIDIAEKYDKTIFLSGRSMVENVAIAKELGYINIKPGVVKKMTPKNTEGILPHKQIIITTGSQGEQFSALARMSEGKHNSVEIIKGDTVVFSSSVVPGNEKSVVGIINKLIKLGANVVTKDDGEVHTGGHAFQEEQKIMINLVKPKYFMPIFGDLYFRTVHKNTAMSLGIKEDNVLMLENGNIVDFAPKNGNVFKSKIKAPIQELIIDGHGMGLATSHVIKAREKMMNSGVLVIMFKVDKKTKAILGHIKLESRGLVYLEEVRFIHRMIIKKARDIYENTVKDVPDMEEKDLVKILRDDLEKFLLQKIDREPMIIPMLTEV